MSLPPICASGTSLSLACPSQSGFHDIDVSLSPHNLHGFNPNILVRYQPEYNEWFENTFMRSYVPPYSSEFEQRSA